MAGSITEIILVRHGETDWNKERRLQGQLQPGPPLNTLGFKQAEVTARVLSQRFSSFDAILSSDVLRAVQTAEILATPYNMQVSKPQSRTHVEMLVTRGVCLYISNHILLLRHGSQKLLSISSASRIYRGKGSRNKDYGCTRTVLPYSSVYGTYCYGIS